MIKCGKGFTLTEFLVGVTFLIAAFVLLSPGCGSAREKAREAEVISNCHTIQIALERYATDHHEKYPKQIYGGDAKGWSLDWFAGKSKGCRSVGVGRDNPSKAPPPDPLIFFGYINQYPKNPFADNFDGGARIIAMTGGTTKPGYGDPRFGYNGDVMGNCLNDPRYLWETTDDTAEPTVTNEQYMIYDWEGTRSKSIRMVNPDRKINPFYSMGGIPNTPAKNNQPDQDGHRPTILKHWPGQFFYRSGGDFFLVGSGHAFKEMESRLIDEIWDWPYSRVNRYILGGYGSHRTSGFDVIRLTDKNGNAANNLRGSIDDIYITHPDYRDNPDDATTSWFYTYVSTPEVFGGGGFGKMPVFPYWGRYNRKWIYGAPDGYPDGVIVTLFSKSDSHKFD